MSNLDLKHVIKKVQVAYEVKISRATETLEQEYFNNPNNLVPMRVILSNGSFDQQFDNFSEFVRNASPNELDKIFKLISNFFLFSPGFDIVFKSKLLADMYTSNLMSSSTYKMMEEAIMSNYNNMSVMPENPNYDDNMRNIEEMVVTYYDVQALLNALYCNDFQFPANWKDLCHNGKDDALKILQKSNMTIGEYLNSVIDHKCSILVSIFSKVENARLKNEYFARIQVLRDEKKGEVSNYEYSNLPIAYFYDHRLEDYMREKVQASIQKKKFGYWN